MSKEELEIFYQLDEGLYLVKHNPSLRKVLETLDSEYKLSDVQKFINKLIAWYHVKFSDKYLEGLETNETVDSEILTVMSLDKLMNSYGSFEEELFAVTSSNEGKIVCQKHLIVMAGWGLIYQKDTNPQYGYYRASKLLNDFNATYHWGLSPTIYQKVLTRNYSLDDPEISELLEKIKKKKDNKTGKSYSISSDRKRFTLKKVRSLFSR